MVVHSHKWLVFFCILVVIGSCRSQTLWDKIKGLSSTYNTTTFKSLVEGAGDAYKFINVDKMTVFIPVNSAFETTFKDGIDKLSVDKKKKLLFYHMATLVDTRTNDLVGLTSNFDNADVLKRGTDIGFGKFVIMNSKAENSPLYWLKGKSSTDGGSVYHINNARFIKNEYDQQAGTGVFHLISEVIFPVGISSVMEAHLKNTKDFSTFWDLYNTLDKTKIGADQLASFYKGTFKQKIGTFFIPKNAAFADVPTEEMQKLKGDQTKLLHFLASHVAYEQPIFVAWMKDHTKINPKLGMGETVNYQIDSTVYWNPETKKNFVSAGGVVAEVVGLTLPVQNGLLFTINKPLNFLYGTVSTTIQRKAPDFHAACVKTAKCKAYMDSGNSTFFAPKNFPHGSLEAAKLEQLLLLHVLPNQRKSMATMGDPSITIDAADGSGKLRFYQTASKTTVDGRLEPQANAVYKQGYVGSQIEEGDLATTDGMVQVITHPLGIPRLSILGLLADKMSNFSKLMEYLADVDVDFKQLDSKTQQRYTMFAPTAEAFAQMTDDTGKAIINSESQRVRMLKRLIVPNTVLLSSYQPGTTLNVQTILPLDDDRYERSKITIKMRENKEKQLEASVNIGETNRDTVVLPFQSEWGCTNGIVYAIDVIPYGATTLGKACKQGTTCAAPGLPSRLAWPLLLVLARLVRWLAL